MQRIKVLHYTPGFNSGGIESRLLDWYRNIERDKIQFCLIKLNNIDDTENISEFKSLGGEVYNLPPLNIRNLYSYFKKLIDIFHENKFDVIHVHDLSSGIFPLIIAKYHNIHLRILHSRTTDYLPDEKNLIIKKFLKRLTTLFANEYFSCSVEAGIWAFGEKNKNFRVIKNGIQIDRFNFDTSIRRDIRIQLGIDDKKVVGAISRLSPQKNLLFLIDIFNDINKKNRDTVLVLVGEGVMREDIIKKARDLNLENKIILIGEKKNVWDYYMAFDVFVATSFYEGFGTTAIESQAVGTPTVLSTGFPEVVCVTSIVTRISLEESIQKWSNKILSYLEIRRELNNIDTIIEAGYCANNVAKELQNIYMSYDGKSY